MVFSMILMIHDDLAAGFVPSDEGQFASRVEMVDLFRFS